MVEHLQPPFCSDTTVDGRNPAPVIGFHTSQVVQDFSHQRYHRTIQHLYTHYTYSISTSILSIISPTSLWHGSPNAELRNNMEFQAPSVVLLEAAKSSSARETLRVTFKSASPWNKYLTAYGVSRSKCAKRHHKWTNSFGCYFDLQYFDVFCASKIWGDKEKNEK